MGLSDAQEFGSPKFPATKIPWGSPCDTYGNPQVEVTFLQKIEVGVMGVLFEEEH